MNNLLLKLGSLLAATCLAVFVNYFFAPSEFGPSVVQLIAPVEIRNVPENKAVIWPSTRQVELTVQGSSLFLSRVAYNPPVVRVSIPEAAAKSFIVKLSAENVALPAAIRLLGIKPAELEFGLDDIIDKTLPVVVPQIGVLSQDLKLVGVKVEPQSVRLRGPSEELKHALNIETNPVNLTTIEATRDFDLELRLPWSIVDAETRTVKATVEVSDANSEVSFSSVPILLEVQNEGLKSRNPRLNQKAVSVVLRGPRKILKSVKKESLVVRAQLASEEQLKDSLVLTLDPIDAVTSALISPRRVEVVIDPAPTPTPTPNVKSGVAKNRSRKSG